MTVMDPNMQPKTNALKRSQPPAFQHQSPTRRHLRIYTVVVVFATLLGLRILTGKSTLRAWLIPEAVVFPPHRHHLSTEAKEALFISIPNADSALEASLAYATHPHLAGSTEDLLDAKAVLRLFQDELGIKRPPDGYPPIYDAGSKESRNATLRLTTPRASRQPNAWIDTYYPLIDIGTEQRLMILNSNGTPAWNADLVEDGDPDDRDAHKYRDAIPPWHGLSADGDVTGQLVYVNYGRKEDYDELVTKGVNFTGKIVLARNGGIMRGLKIKGAQDLGAVGVLMYNDPRDDGYMTVENGFAPYPAGPARNPTSIERGGVIYSPLTYPGDPTTPGYPAYSGAKRTEPMSMPTVPSLPISWQNAQRLFSEIGNPYVVDGDGRKHLSGRVSDASVRLVNRVDTKVTPIWNVMASIPGYISDEVVIIGCHRDAWVMGAADPTSGTISLLEIVRGYGTLLRRGWRPLRTIVFASWDGEEYGMIGSTEWGEDFALWIQEHVVAYVQVDGSSAGSRFSMSGSPSLANLLRQTAMDLPHPTRPNASLWDATKDQGPFAEAAVTGIIDSDFKINYEMQELEKSKLKTGVSLMGSGSDFTVFLQHLGIACSDQVFDTTPTDAVYHYHSIYDSHAWQVRYGDPTFKRHVSVAQFLGLIGLRVADSIILPLNTTQYSLELDEYLDTVEAFVPALGNTSREVHFSSLRKAIKQLQLSSAKLDVEKHEAEETFKRLLRQMRPSFPGGCRPTGFLRWVPNWVRAYFGIRLFRGEELQRMLLCTAESWQEWLGYATTTDLEEGPCAEGYQHGLSPPIRKLIKAAKRIGRANKKLKAFERGFISEGGLNDREWYKHLGVAPGRWLGYDATTLPALTEAVKFDKNITSIRYEAERLEGLLIKLAETITLP